MGELNRRSDWAFVDFRFSENFKNCGALMNDEIPNAMLFSDLQAWLRNIGESTRRPLNLVLGAPLSVAFNSSGNPTGRAIERRGPVTRY